MGTFGRLTEMPHCKRLKRVHGPPLTSSQYWSPRRPRLKGWQRELTLRRRPMWQHVTEIVSAVSPIVLAAALLMTPAALGDPTIKILAIGTSSGDIPADPDDGNIGDYGPYGHIYWKASDQVVSLASSIDGYTTEALSEGLSTC